jgi:flagellar hook-associated protein 3 FlgL
MSNQTDVILNEFETTMNRMRTLLVQAGNGTNDPTSLDSIATELRGIETHFKGLANSSINGQYLFSGIAVDVKSIAADGTYMGNDQIMNSFTGSKTQ